MRLCCTRCRRIRCKKAAKVIGEKKIEMIAMKELLGGNWLCSRRLLTDWHENRSRPILMQPLKHWILSLSVQGKSVCS